MGLIVVILGLALICGLALFRVSIIGVSRRAGSMRPRPMSRQQIAVRLVALAAVVAAGWLLFPFLWVAFFGYGCCNP